jgi:uncharacterized protein with HEPN domain
MPRREANAFLNDAITACEFAVTMTQGMDTDRYRRDLVVRSAVEHQLMIIGEALNRAERLSPGIRSRITDFSRIVAFRNMIVHGYFMVDEQTVLEIIRTHVPVLVAELRSVAALLPPSTDGPSPVDSGDTT